MAALTLGIGLTAFTSCLTLVDSLLGVPPYARDASTIVFGEPGRDAAGLAASPLSYDAIGLPPGVMSRGSAQTAEAVNVRVGNQEKFASAQRVDAGFLPTLGVKSALAGGMRVEVMTTTSVVSGSVSDRHFSSIPRL